MQALLMLSTCSIHTLLIHSFNLLPKFHSLLTLPGPLCHAVADLVPLAFRACHSRPAALLCAASLNYLNYLSRGELTHVFST